MPGENDNAYAYVNDPISSADPSGLSRIGNDASVGLSQIYSGAGVYRITRGDGKIYVGQSVHIRARIKQHVKTDRFNEYGIESVDVIKMPGSTKLKREYVEEDKIRELLGDNVAFDDDDSLALNLQHAMTIVRKEMAEDGMTAGEIASLGALEWEFDA